MTITGYPFDEYDGSDESFEKLQDWRDNVSAERVTENVQPWQLATIQAVNDWVAEARQATGRVCPDPVNHNLHTDGIWEVPES